ncbi:MAG: NfeD family protein [Alphaproteobacteria bacterium]|nr:NfeD family protein [Alphaproteobacteria bacterium]
MEPFAAIFNTITLWHWLVLGAVLIGLEVIAPSTYLLWPGLAALATGGIVALMPELGWQYHLVLFAVLSVAATILGRRYAVSGGEATDQPLLNRRASQYVGRVAVVAEAFAGGRGPIILDDTRWPAKDAGGQDLKPGTRVEIIGTDGPVLSVKAV